MRSTYVSFLHKCFSLAQFLSTYLFTFISAVLKMFKGKEKHQDLIQELRTVHALKREEQELQKADKEHVMMLNKQRDKRRLEVKHTDLTTWTKMY